MADLPAPIDIEMIRGDTESFLMTARLSGALMDLTGASIWMTAKDDLADVDGSAIFQKTVGSGIVIDPDQAGAGKGKATITISPADTVSVVNPASAQHPMRLAYDVQVKVSGVTTTVQRGALIVVPDVTKAT